LTAVSGGCQAVACSMTAETGGMLVFYPGPGKSCGKMDSRDGNSRDARKNRSRAILRKRIALFRRGASERRSPFSGVSRGIKREAGCKSEKKKKPRR